VFALGNSLFACGVCSTCERSFEEARGDVEVGRQPLPPLLAPEPRPLWTRPTRTQTEPQPATSSGVILPETGNSCCYARYSCGNSCNVVVKLVKEYHCFLTHFTSILLKQIAANDTFVREANSYKRALTLRDSPLVQAVTTS